MLAFALAIVLPSSKGWAGLTWPQVVVLAIGVAGLIAAGYLLDPDARQWVQGVIYLLSGLLLGRMPSQTAAAPSRSGS